MYDHTLVLTFPGNLTIALCARVCEKACVRCSTILGRRWGKEVEEEEGREGAVTAPRQAEASFEWTGHLPGTLDPPVLFLFSCAAQGI